jgi:hypothetical protein
MQDVISQAIEREQPCGLIIDLRQLDYPGGDWIAWGCLHRRLPSCRTCLVAVGQTWKLVRLLWEACHLDAVVAVFETLEQAEEYVRSK